MTLHQDREFAPVPVHQRHFDSRFLLQGGRQTGGMLADTSSDRALPDDDVLHGIPSFCLKPLGGESPQATRVQLACRSPASVIVGSVKSCRRGIPLRPLWRRGSSRLFARVSGTGSLHAPRVKTGRVR
jgi:hypothetical protein